MARLYRRFITGNSSSLKNGLLAPRDVTQSASEPLNTSIRDVFRVAACVLGFAAFTAGADVEKLRVLALFENKAILEVDGKRRVLGKGETSPEGVQLIEANSERAIVVANGRQETLHLDVVAGSFASTGPARVTLFALGDAFHANGSINDFPVRFLVDTGATSIALNSATARKIGLDFRKGRQGIAQTASGYVKVYSVKLRKVQIGDIVLHDVDAGIIDGPQPEVALLGMSFLNSVEMRREGARMELIKR